jgi:nicotinamide mononucleotide transporter
LEEITDFNLTNHIFQDIVDYCTQMGVLEFGGLIFGLLCVIFLIKQNILTWICGIIYVFISFVVFWEARLYGDFLLHIFFLVLNIYGGYAWAHGGSREQQLTVSYQSKYQFLSILFISTVGIFLFAQFLIYLPSWIEGLEEAALPYWDSTTSILSVAGMWLTTRKKIENWYYWLVVDVLATGIYYYKELYFYSFLYFVYIGLAVIGYRAWLQSFRISQK